MRRYFFLLIAAGAIFSIALAYQVPRVTPKPLKETQDPAQVRAHEERVQRETKPNSPPVVEPDWIKQIQRERFEIRAGRRCDSCARSKIMGVGSCGFGGADAERDLRDVLLSDPRRIA